MARPSSDQRRQEILDAVVDVIIDIGYTEMTIADVADRCGVSNALVHYHFASKEKLIAAALRAASGDDKRFRDAIVEGPGSATWRLDRVLCESLPTGPADGSWLLWIETWGETRRSAELRSIMADLEAHETAAVATLIAHGVAAHEFDCGDATTTAIRLTALRDGLAVDRTLFHPEVPTDELFERLRAAIRLDLGLTEPAYVEHLATRLPSP
jgi:AcrR family transcriptional regulator